MGNLATMQDLRQAAVLAPLSEALLERLLAGASARIEQFCNRSFASAEATELYDGDGSEQLIVKRYPIISISELKILDTVNEVADDPVTITSSQYVIIGASGRILLKPTTLLCFERGVQNISIKYIAGFATIPGDVVMATILLASHLAGPLTRDPTMSSTTLGDYSESYMSEASQRAAGKELPLAVRELLAPYRSIL